MDWRLCMIKDEIPKVSCLTVTTGRLEHIKRAVHCYLIQTYPNREMVLLSQGEDNEPIAEFIRSLNRDDIIFQTAPSSLTLGAMRNASVELATGSVMCQWDDDDLYHPDRIRTQYRALHSDNRNTASAYSAFLKYFKNTGEVYWCDWSGEGTELSQLLCGAVMFYKRVFHEYGSLIYPQEGAQCHVEEDLNVLEKLFLAGNVAPVREGHHYVYAYHGENTYDLEHHKLTLLTNSGKVIMDKENLLKRRDLLNETFGLIQMDSCTIRSLDDEAFTYRAP